MTRWGNSPSPAAKAVVIAVMLLAAWPGSPINLGPAEAASGLQDWMDSMSQRVSANQKGGSPAQPGPFFSETATVTEGFKTFYVDPSGNAQFKNVKDAVNAIPSDKTRTDRIVIKLSPGTYYEQVVIGKDKPYVTIQGSGKSNTMISWKEDLGQSGSDFTDAACQVYGDFFTAIDVSFQNTSPAPPSGAEKMQATAFAISGSKAAFVRVGFYGYQDTLYDKDGYHYYQDCYIAGSIDFIYGDGCSFFTHCQLHVEPVRFGSLTAQKRLSMNEDTGYSFVGCGVTGQGFAYFGRAWGKASRTVFSHSYIGNVMNPQGWQDWGVRARDKTVYYGEYKNYGPGANRNGRVAYSRELTDEEAAPFQTIDFINGYDWLRQSGIGS